MEQRSTISILVGALAMLQLAAGTAAAQERQESPVPDVTGTYDVTICRDSCDSEEQVRARGTIVIEARPYSITSVPEPARTYFEKFEKILLHIDAEYAPNACFVLSSRRAGTLFGTTPVGLTKWTRMPGDTLALRLYHSPDAGYDTRLSIRSEMLVGRGGSWGPWDESQNSPPDHIVATRIGPPDRDLCMRAAERRLAELRR